MTLGARVAVLAGGRLEQVAPPRELYERPATAFVAGFLGSPPMALFETRLVRAGGRLAVEVGRHAVPLPDDHPARAAAASWQADRPLTAGLRAEALALAPATTASPGPAPAGPAAAGLAPAAAEAPGRAPAPTAETVIEGRLELAESLGHETLAHVALARPGAAPIRLVARLPGLPALAPGSPIRLALDARRLQLFDESGRALRG
jgi:multiple sugar transport system ATP-binding protein